jgi:hypothetical protein
MAGIMRIDGSCLTKKERENMKIIKKPLKHYNDEAESIDDVRGITNGSYDKFCRSFDATVGAGRKQEKGTLSCEIDAYEELMLTYPRELAFYIIDLTNALAAHDYLRSVLRRLLMEPRKEPSINPDPENMGCAGSA